MTVQTRTGLRAKVRNFAYFMDGVRECAAAAETGRRPSRSALNAVGIDPETYYGIGR